MVISKGTTYKTTWFFELAKLMSEAKYLICTCRAAHEVVCQGRIYIYNSVVQVNCTPKLLGCLKNTNYCIIVLSTLQAKNVCKTLASMHYPTFI